MCSQWLIGKSIEIYISYIFHVFFGSVELKLSALEANMKVCFKESPVNEFYKPMDNLVRIYYIKKSAVSAR